MKKRGIFLLCISSLIIVFSIIIGVFIDDSLTIVSDRNKIIYYCSKTICLGALIAISLLFFKKKDIGNFSIQYSLTLIYQIIPLIIRIIGNKEKGFILNLIIFFLTFICYLLVVISFSFLSDKIVEQNLTTEEIEIKDENYEK